MKGFIYLMVFFNNTKKYIKLKANVQYSLKNIFDAIKENVLEFPKKKLALDYQKQLAIK
jgi:hypothetical protein